ncbi:MAG: hypothetical protein ACTHJN_04965 [Ginsengibacter sp.]
MNLAALGLNFSTKSPNWRRSPSATVGQEMDDPDGVGECLLRRPDKYLISDKSRCYFSFQATILSLTKCTDTFLCK